MRLGILLAMALFAAPVGLFSQSSSANVPPGFVDGAKNPDLIPDTAAYRLVFLSLSVPPSADAKTLSKQSALAAQLRLSEGDTRALKNTMAAFASDYAAWRASAQSAGPTATAAQLSAEVTALIQRYRTFLVTSLTADGSARLAQFVQSAKSRMVVRP